LLSHAITQLPLPNGERKISRSRLGQFVFCGTFNVFRLENREE
jgi:hypothetical protein